MARVPPNLGGGVCFPLVVPAEYEKVCWLSWLARVIAKQSFSTMLCFAAFGSINSVCASGTKQVVNSILFCPLLAWPKYVSEVK